MSRAASFLLVALLAALVFGAAAPGAPPSAPPKAPPREAVSDTPTEEQIVAAFGRKEYARAIQLIDRALADAAKAGKPIDPLMHYNAACALALMSRPNDATDRLLLAVKYGFRDFQHMERDPDLDSVRGHASYRAIVEAQEQAGRTAAKNEVDRWRERFGTDRYRYESDEDLNLHFATALDQRAHERMRQMLSRQAKQQIATIFAGAPKEAVFIAVPTNEDSRAFFRDLAKRDSTFDNPNVAGIYEHRPRRLVSTDIGASLRHEFTHAMHYGDMERLGQPHPLWIQEGIAALYEEYEYPKDAAVGAIDFLPNERDEVIRGLVKGGTAMPWKRLVGIEGAEFMKKPQQLYPQVRSIFRFVAAKQKLGDWYRAYTKTFDEDRTGRLAFEKVFDMPMETVERDWRKWVVEQGPVDRGIQPGDASLGVAIEDVPDGALITAIIPSAAGARSGLRKGDVIVSIDGKGIASSNELVMTIAARKLGETVRVQVRRAGEYKEILVKLEAMRG